MRLYPCGTPRLAGSKPTKPSPATAPASAGPLSPELEEVDRKARAFQEANPALSYADALKAVAGGKEPPRPSSDVLDRRARRFQETRPGTPYADALRFVSRDASAQKPVAAALGGQDLDQKARQFQETNPGTPYADALKQVSRM